MHRFRTALPLTLTVLALALLAACSSDGAEPTASVAASAQADGEASTFVADVWADNWFALYVNGELVAEDSVPITTERSFNKETVEFEATYPLTIAVEAKDFKETDSGIEYIGANNQQMGDGGLILQIADQELGGVVLTSTNEWKALVIHQAPLNKECEKDPDPDATCQTSISDAPAAWTAPDFDDSGWASATEWSEDAVSPKDGYDEVNWSSGASLIWGTDLETDNTVLLRFSTN